MSKHSITVFFTSTLVMGLMLTACIPVTNTNPSTYNTQTQTPAATGDTINETTTAENNTSTPTANTFQTVQTPEEPLPATSPSGNAPGGSAASSPTFSSLYKLDGAIADLTDQIYTATGTDQSAVFVTGIGKLSLSGATITTSGDTSSSELSSVEGLNAAVLANSASTIDLSKSTITTSGSGANGIFAEGSGSAVLLENVQILTDGEYAHGISVSNAASMTLTDVDITTTGAHAAAVASDQGGGTITIINGNINTTGQESPGLYSTGTLTIDNTTISSTQAEAAVIEGTNSISVTNSRLTSSAADLWGVLIYQSMSGDAEGTDGIFTMSGGSLTYTGNTGALFHITNSTGFINLKDVEISVASGILVNASTGTWGVSGANGGTVIFTADEQVLTGNILADNLSSLTLSLQNASILTGAINPENTAQSVNLMLDSTSTWNVTADSYLTCLSITGEITGTEISNITGNGYTVYYDPDTCTDLNGQVYSLAGGGYLKPEGE